MWPEIADDRLRARIGDAAGADPEVAAAMRRRFADWSQAHVLSTQGPAKETVTAAEGLFASDPS